MKTKNRKTLKRQAERGYSIIEVMLTLVVVGVGLLAIVQLQSSISGQVGDNKAKAEATTLAEARLEYLRNYRDLAEYDSDDKLLATSSTEDAPVFVNVPVDEYEPQGVNATFTMQESIAGDEEIREVTVRVSWEDRSGTPHDVTVSSEIAYVPPVSSGQNSITYKSNIDFADPSGIARPGEGKVPDGVTLVDNGDGTKRYDDGYNKYLVVDDNIVMTLEDACNGACTDNSDDFTRIHGRIYIDETTYQNLPLEEVNVIASNTAYCSRFVKDPQSSQITPIVNEPDVPVTGNKTPTEDYEYFDYTCYVGRGWYGSIGIYLAGGNKQADRICMGDPDSTEVALSTYRLYRGEMYTPEDADATGYEKTYWSIGLPGSLDLGLDVNGEPMHNFVVSSISSTKKLVDQDCIDKGILVRQDAIDTALFRDVPGDFVCLNEIVDYSNQADLFDDSVYGTANICDKNPTEFILE